MVKGNTGILTCTVSDISAEPTSITWTVSGSGVDSDSTAYNVSKVAFVFYLYCTVFFILSLPII